MKLLKKLLGTDKVIDSVGGIIDDLVTTKEEKIQAKTKLKEIMNSYKIEVEKNITEKYGDIVKEESKNNLDSEE